MPTLPAVRPAHAVSLVALAAAPRVLLVEDDDRLARIVVLGLRKAGLECLRVPAEQAEAAARAGRYAAAAVDLPPDRPDRLLLCRSLRDAGLPVVSLGGTEPADAARPLAQGAGDANLAKPFVLRTLADRLTALAS